MTQNSRRRDEACDPHKAADCGLRWQVVPENLHQHCGRSGLKAVIAQHPAGVRQFDRRTIAPDQDGFRTLPIRTDDHLHQTVRRNADPGGTPRCHSAQGHCQRKDHADRKRGGDGFHEAELARCGTDQP